MQHVMIIAAKNPQTATSCPVFGSMQNIPMKLAPITSDKSVINLRMLLATPTAHSKIAIALSRVHLSTATNP